MPKANAVFAIDGFEISATFAESQTSSTRPGVILVKPSEQRDNNGGDSPYVP